MVKLSDGTSLTHYASENYNPQKAHEYYLRTRELKERNPAMTSTQKEVFNVVKDSISTKKKAEGEKAQADQKARLEQFRKTAEESRDRILASLKAKLEDVKVATPIPRDATPKLRAFLIRQQKIQAGNARAAAASELKKLGPALSDAVNQARVSYAASMKAMNEKYKATTETEAKNIRTQVQ